MTVGAPTVIFLTVGAQRSERTLHKNVYISQSSLCILVCRFLYNKKFFPVSSLQSFKECVRVVPLSAVLSYTLFCKSRGWIPIPLLAG